MNTPFELRIFLLLLFHKTLITKVVSVVLWVQPSLDSFVWTPAFDADLIHVIGNKHLFPLLMCQARR